MSSPVPQVDYTATVVRPRFTDLPDAVRLAVGEAAGSPVVQAMDPPGSGFTGSFAAVVHLADGRSVFAKAGSGANPHVVRALAQEARVLAALPADVPAPRLLGAQSLDEGVADEHAWQALVLEHVRGRLPQPWTDADLAGVHDACLAAAQALTPAPAVLDLPRLDDDLRAEDRTMAYFARLASGDVEPTWGQPAWLVERAADLSDLARAAPDLVAGATACHGDLRADNVLLDPGGRAWFVDWNWLALGAAWTDLVGVLPLARADGVDADAWLRRSPLTRDVDPHAVDAWLAVVAAYMLGSCEDPPWVGGSTMIRVHQRRYARTYLDWLGERRRWS